MTRSLDRMTISPPRGTWVQTDRAAHEAWARLCLRSPLAASVLHYLAAHVGDQQAVVVSQTVLASVLGASERGIQLALATLAAERWIQRVRIGRGRECAYVLNSRVAWTQSREALPLALFSATVVASAHEQEPAALSGPPLRRLPVLWPWEQQLPTGEGEPPVSQPALPSLEPDLPAVSPLPAPPAEPPPSRRRRQSRRPGGSGSGGSGSSAGGSG